MTTNIMPQRVPILIIQAPTLNKVNGEWHLKFSGRECPPERQEVFAQHSVLERRGRERIWPNISASVRALGMSELT